MLNKKQIKILYFKKTFITLQEIQSHITFDRSVFNRNSNKKIY